MQLEASCGWRRYSETGHVEKSRGIQVDIRRWFKVLNTDERSRVKGSRGCQWRGYSARGTAVDMRLNYKTICIACRSVTAEFEAWRRKMSIRRWRFLTEDLYGTFVFTMKFESEMQTARLIDSQFRMAAASQQYVSQIVLMKCIHRWGIFPQINWRTFPAATNAFLQCPS